MHPTSRRHVRIFTPTPGQIGVELFAAEPVKVDGAAVSPHNPHVQLAQLGTRRIKAQLVIRIIAS